MLLKDGVRSHPKVLKAGAEAAWLWACCIDYSRSQLTDGFVPTEALPTLALTKLRVSTLVESLCKVGLLHREESGVRVHDYLDHNDSAEEVKEAKRKDSERKRVRIPDVVPSGFQSDSSRIPNDPRARVGVGVGNGVGTAPLNGGSHKAHALCGQVCLPAFLFSEFVRLVGGDEREARATVDAWWMTLDDELQAPHAPIGDAVAYLRARWAADHPTVKPQAKAIEFDVAAWAAKGM